MNYFDPAQEFIERSQGLATVDDLATSFSRISEALGFRHFACWSHVDPLRPPCRAVVIHTYPDAWVRLLSERQLFEIDPVSLYADRTLLPFFWDAQSFRERLTRPQHELLAEASAFGISHGYTIPIHLPCSRLAYRASCSLVPDSSLLAPASYHTVQLMAYHMYEAAMREVEVKDAEMLPAELSRRERQCLELVAQGKSDWVAGKLLGISERTVHNHIERVKRRLRVTTRVQAIVLALATRQISFGDVIKTEHRDRRSATQ